MGINNRILTQNDLSALNAALEQIAANLRVHVNESLSIAHGINAEIANYYDDAGDQWGNVVLVFEFGTPPDVTRILVPAQFTSLGPASTSNGLISTLSGPAGTFSSPGTPLGNRPLVTELTTESKTQAEVYDNLLLAHAAKVYSGQGADQCHGGRSFTNTSVTDSLGHVVGRKFVTIGVNGTAWKLPGDVFADGSIYGPPQLIRGINLFANSVLKHNVAHMGRDGEQFCAFWLSALTGGTQPYTVAWEINQLPDGTSTTWNSMSDTTPGWHLANTQREVYYDISAGSPVGSYNAKFRTDFSNDHRQLVCTVRANIANEAGSIYTNYCRFYANDEDGCSFAGLITFSEPDTNSRTWFEVIPGSPAFQP